MEHVSICFRRLLLIMTVLVNIETAAASQIHAINRTAVVGRATSLPCRGLSAAVVWLHEPKQPSAAVRIIADNGRILDDHRHRIERRTDTGHPNDLVITEVQPDDAGLYKCIERGSPATLRAVQLVVASAVDKTVHVGDDVTLECRIHSHVLWRFQSSRTHLWTYVFSHGKIVAEDEKRFNVSFADGDKSLTIHDVQKSDEGVYLCVEDSGMGPGEVRTKLTVKPAIKRSRHLQEMTTSSASKRSDDIEELAALLSGMSRTQFSFCVILTSVVTQYIIRRVSMHCLELTKCLSVEC